MNQALQTIERRVNELGVAEPIVARHGAGDQILVQLPGVTDVDARQGDHPVDGAARAEARRAGPVRRRGRGAPGLRRQRAARHGDRAGRRRGRARRAGRHRATTWCAAWRPSPAATCATRGRRSTRTTAGGELLAEPARARASSARSPGDNIGRQLAIVLDGRVQSAPRIEARINDEGRITGSFTQQEAQDLSLMLRSGALPASLTYLEERTVGPSLGADSIRAGVIAVARRPAAGRRCSCSSTTSCRASTRSSRSSST